MKNTVIITLWILLLGSSQVFAHSKLASSTPADGQSLQQSPNELLLNFNRPVTLMTVVVELIGAKQAVATDFKASSDAQQQYQLSLPRLAPGGYQVRWMALGADGHKVKGGFVFVVLPVAAGVEGILPDDMAFGAVIVACAKVMDSAILSAVAVRAEEILPFSTSAPLMVVVTADTDVGVPAVVAAGAMNFSLVVAATGRGLVNDDSGQDS